MKKGKLLLLVLLCSMLAACKKDGTADIESTESPTIEGVGILQEKSLYDYAYEEQSGGTLLFSVKGDWGENLSWVLNDSENGVANVEELSQTANEVKYQFSPKENKGGYWDYEIVLCDKETKEIHYTYIVSVMQNTEAKTLMVLSVYFDELSEEITENTEETESEEVLSTEELELLTADEAKFHEVVGDFTVPKEITNFYESAQVLEINEEETTVGAISFFYEEEEYGCIISPSVPLSRFQAMFGIPEEEWEIKVINEVEVSFYQAQDYNYIMWKAPEEGHRYIVLEKDINGEIGFEAAELLMKQ